MCVGKNTSQAASVEFCRKAAKLCAQQTASLLSENSEGIFDSLIQTLLPYARGPVFYVFFFPAAFRFFGTGVTCTKMSRTGRTSSRFSMSRM